MLPMVRGFGGGGGDGAGPHAHAEGDITPDGILARVADAETWVALQTFNAGVRLGGGAIEDSGGTARVALATSSPHITLTGAVDINSGFLAVGNTATPTTAALINAQHDFALGSFAVGYGLNASTIKDIGAGVSAALALIGITGGVQNRRSAGTLYVAEGLFFEATHNPTGNSTTNVLRGARVRTQVQSANGGVPTNECLHLEIGSSAGALGPPTVYVVRPNHMWNGTVPGTLFGYYSPVLPAASVAAYHAYWGSITTPHFRCDGGNPPNAGLGTEGDSPAWLLWMENGSLASRRLRWRQQSSLGATDKVLIAA